ncbi:MAG TPA: hypothetical protein VFX58_06130 [Chitinophagaceae bacterium]|nr:hypothetical protein [Chitinophagaceae bacterium]
MILFRVVCFLQMLLTVFLSFTSLMYLIRTGRFYFFLESVFFILIASLAILGISLVATNYPDKPVAGKQKIVFNWLFLLNFLLLSFLFGLVFAEFRQLEIIASLFDKPVFTLSFQLMVPFITNLIILGFQFIILYGLYTLRRQLFENFFASQQFEFENKSQD